MSEFGGPEVLAVVEVPVPEPGPDDVAIRCAAVGITFVETQVRAGRPPWPGPGPSLPLVPGNGVAGEIIVVGDEVDPALVGRSVVAATGGSGACSEVVVVAAADAIPVPRGVSPGEAVALLADGRTALALARAAQLSPGDRVLVLAAAGGVGCLLVQLACAADVSLVVAATGGPRKVAVARDLGAGLAIDYSRTGWSSEIEATIGGLDVVFDGVGGQLGAEALGILDPGGRLVAFGAASGAFSDTAGASARGITVIAGHTAVHSPDDNRALVEQALGLAAAGRLRPIIGQSFPLARANDAHAAIEARATIGKTVLVLDAPAPVSG